MQANNEPSFTLPAQLTAETADVVTEALRGLSIASHHPFLFNASQVENLTSSGAQVLVSLHKSVTAVEGEFRITGYQPLFSQALADMGLSWLVNSSNA